MDYLEKTCFYRRLHFLSRNFGLEVVYYIEITPSQFIREWSGQNCCGKTCDGVVVSLTITMYIYHSPLGHFMFLICEFKGCLNT